MDDEKILLINKIQQFLIENAKQIYKCYDIESFNIFIHVKESLSYLNYVIPTQPNLNNFPIEYAKICEIFKDNSRQIRFEFLKEVVPQLATLLSSVGLKDEYRVDFMICTPDSFIKTPHIDRFLVSYLNKNSSVDELKKFKLTQELSFNEKKDILLNSIDEKDVISSIGKGIGLLGYTNGVIVSACQYTEIIDNITELVGIGTLSEYRSNGFGSAITSAAVQRAFDNGANIVRLSAADDKASKIYSRIGFYKIATMLAYS